MLSLILWLPLIGFLGGSFCGRHMGRGIVFFTNFHIFITFCIGFYWLKDTSNLKVYVPKLVCLWPSFIVYSVNRMERIVCLFFYFKHLCFHKIILHLKVNMSRKKKHAPHFKIFQRTAQGWTFSEFGISILHKGQSGFKSKKTSILQKGFQPIVKHKVDYLFLAIFRKKLIYKIIKS